MLILGPLAATIIQLAISRNREFQADASGAAPDPRPAGAGQRAARRSTYGAQRLPLPAQGQLTSTAHLMIDNPFRGGGIATLFSTHPPMAGAGRAGWSQHGRRHRPGPVHAVQR